MLESPSILDSKIEPGRQVLEEAEVLEELKMSFLGHDHLLKMAKSLAQALQNLKCLILALCLAIKSRPRV